jgi:hypothetical protein
MSGNMGKGTVVWSSSGPSKWEAVEPGSIGQVLMKIACQKE